MDLCAQARRRTFAVATARCARRCTWQRSPTSDDKASAIWDSIPFGFCDWLRRVSRLCEGRWCFGKPHSVLHRVNSPSSTWGTGDVPEIFEPETKRESRHCTLEAVSSLSRPSTRVFRVCALDSLQTPFREASRELPHTVSPRFGDGARFWREKSLVRTMRFSWTLSLSLSRKCARRPRPQSHTPTQERTFAWYLFVSFPPSFRLFFGIPGEFAPRAAVRASGRVQRHSFLEFTF